MSAFNAAIKPKIHGSWNLHNVLPKDLDFFVLLASASGIVGTHGQANYASGNTYQDALARHRVANGLKAVSLDLGIIANVGYVSENESAQAVTSKFGLTPISDGELLALLDYHCNPSLSVLSPSKCQVITGINVTAAGSSEHRDLYWAGRSQFKIIQQMKRPSTSRTIDSEKDVSMATLLSNSDSIEESGKIILKSLIKRLSTILSMPIDDIDAFKPMHVAGVDSLVAVEVRTWFNKGLGVDVTVFEILGNESISEMSLKVAGKSPHCQPNKGETV